MAKVSSTVNRFGGEFMIQDSDHMSGIRQAADNANRGGVQKSELSRSSGRQHGKADNGTSKPQGDRRRQSH